MTRKTKNILLFIGIIFIFIATVLGSFSAKTLSGFYFGEQIVIESVDKDEGDGVGIVNVLLLGVDKGGMRSDTIMLASLNGKTKSINILSIPRDTRVPIGNGYGKINSAIGVGAQEVKRGRLKEPEELAIQKVKLLTGMPVHYFMTVDFDAFIEIIDELGGVDFEVPFDMVYDDPVQGLHINLKKGMQHLNGKQSHDFVRFRQGNPGYKGYAMGDLGRIEAQQKFIRALAEQKLKPQYLLKAGDIFATVKKNVRTNYSAKDLVKHLGTISSVISGDIRVHQMPGRTAMIGGGSYVICDDKKMAELVREYFYPTDQKDEKEASDKDK